MLTRKKIATITDEADKEIELSFDSTTGTLFAGDTEIGPKFSSQEEAAEYIHSSYSRNWNLVWE